MAEQDNSALINNLYQALLGRAPDASGQAYYGNMLQQPDGSATARNEIMNSPEGINYLLGDGYRDYARASTAGLNQMPFVFSDYASFVPGYRAGAKSPLETLYGPSAGTDTINQAQSLLSSIFSTDDKKTAPQPAQATKKNDDPFGQKFAGGGSGGR